MAGNERRQIPGLPTKKVQVSLDVVTVAAVRAAMERDGVNFSRALSALATMAAVTDPVLFQAIKEALEKVALERVAARGWHPGLSAALAQEIVTGEDTGELGWN